MDGDLDLATNNINSPATLLRNYRREMMPDSSHYLALRLQGPPHNPDGLGAFIKVVTCVSPHISQPDAAKMKKAEPQLPSVCQTQYHEFYRVRGYLSSLGPSLHFGLGTHGRVVDSLLLRWPDGRTQVLTQLPVDTILTLSYTDAQPGGPDPRPRPTQTNWHAQPTLRLPYTETDFNDFNFQFLLQRKYSQEGPILATGDLNGDQQDDLVVGGPAGQPVRIYLRTAKGLTLQPSTALAATSPGETTALALFDVDGDGDLDLYVGNGSSEFIGQNHQLLADLLFLNQGKGHFERGPDLPQLPAYTGSLAAADLTATAA
ncbi:MAG: hypothetical protein HC821_04670 [Lewinella sp.]|nr:hypothetical protein [Lewinella sp.]